MDIEEESNDSGVRRLAFTKGILYGRDQELEQLQSLFGQCLSSSHKTSSSEIVFVHGVAGTGKSQLAAKFREEKESKCYFIDGKYDEGSHAKPFSAITAAITKLCDEVLYPRKRHCESSAKEPSDLGIGQRIFKALGCTEGKLLLDMIPKLKEIIRIDAQKQHESQTPGSSDGSARVFLQGTASAYRVTFLFQRLLKSIATKKKPLVLFLDDLQWADQASLRLLHLVLTDATLKNVMFLGSYRENEVDSSHPLYREVLSKLQDQNVVYSNIALGNLKLNDVQSIVADTLDMPGNLVYDLAEAIYNKTHGNVFYAKLQCRLWPTSQSLNTHMSPTDGLGTWIESRTRWSFRIMWFRSSSHGLEACRKHSNRP